MWKNVEQYQMKVDEFSNGFLRGFAHRYLPWGTSQRSCGKVINPLILAWGTQSNITRLLTPKILNWMRYPLENIQKTMENHHVHGKTYNFYGHFQ